MDIDKHKKQFGNQAKNYTQYRRPYIEDVHRLLFSQLPDGSARVLDIACGTGKSTEPLVKKGLEIFGIDHDPLMIDEAKKQAKLKNLNINYRVAEVENLPFENEYFDAVTVGTAFHWFAKKPVLAEIKRLLKSQGLFFIFWTLTTKDVPEGDSISSEIFASFNWEKVPPELRNLDHVSTLLKEEGFKSVSTARIPFVHSDTVEDQVGLIKTASSYEILSDQDKKSFIEKITFDLTEKLGDRPHFTYEEEIQVCFGFK